MARFSSFNHPWPWRKIWTDSNPNKNYIHCPKCGVGQYDFNKSCFKCGCKFSKKK